MTPSLALTLLAQVVGLPPLMPVSEVQRGQVGECLTVFEGDKIEPFGFTVKGVMENALGPGSHIILIRLTGAKPEFTGVVAGMSGSPCSIEGKLVGALAYAFGEFAKEPIAGITPARDMLDVLDYSDEPRPWRLALDEPSWLSMRLGAAERAPPGQDAIRPIAAPLSVGGVRPEVVAYFAPWLERSGFQPIAGSARAKTGGKGATLHPGSAVAAVLVSGDVDISAAGTVTVVDDGRILAFGHPFFGVGAASLPFAQSEIVNTMVSSLRSYKMSAVGPILGELTSDRLTAISGRLGPAPRMVPVKGSLQRGASTDRFQFDVARDPTLTPRFLAIGTAGALASRVEVGERGTVRLTGTIKTQGLPDLKIENVYAAERDANLLAYAAVDMAQRVATLWDTPLGPPPDMSIEVDVAFDPTPIVELILDVDLDRKQARPGDTVAVAITVRREDGPVSTVMDAIQVPRAWAGKEIDIIVAGAPEAQKLGRELEGGWMPQDLGQIVRWLERQRTDGQLYVLAIAREPALMRDGVPMAKVPPSMVAQLGATPGANLRPARLLWEHKIRRSGTVEGGARRRIRVVAD